MQTLTEFYQVGDSLHSVWGRPYDGGQAGASVGYDRVTSIKVDRADGPMGHYAVAVVYRGFDIWQVLPLHMMEEVVVTPAMDERSDT